MMKSSIAQKTWYVFAATLVVCAILLVPQKTLANDHQLILATGEFPPHISSKEADGGSFTKIVQVAFSYSGYDTEIRYFPWKRAWKEALNLRADASYSWSPKPERKKVFFYTDPIANIERRLFTARHNGFYASDFKALTGKSLCRPLAYTLHGPLKDMADAGLIMVIRPEDMKNCFQLAAKGRVDFIEADHFEGLAAIKAAGFRIDEMRLLNITSAKNPNNLIVAKTHPKAQAILSAFNAGMAHLHRSGRHGEILEKAKQAFIKRLNADKTN